MKHIILTLSLVLIIPHLYVEAQQPNLKLIARPLADSIILRWAPTNYKTWNLGNLYGYKLVRYTLIRDSAMLPKSEISGPNTYPMKPDELYKWEPLVKKNKYAAIAAQALYGKNFQIDAGEGFNPQNVYNKAKEQEQRFAFALYAADMSPLVARASALWFSDKTAKKNEKYLYRVFINLPDSLKSGADTAFVFTGISEYWPLPAPIEFSAEFEDKLSKLTWNILAQNNIYVAWEIERSSDKGRNYKLISPDVMVPFSDGNYENLEYSFKFDSLPQNGFEYCYRLRGISSFGEYSPWSKVIKGKGIESIPVAPNISGYNIDKKGILIKWEFPIASESKVNGFKILRSEKSNIGFTDVSGIIKPNKREFIDKKPINTAYYKVVAFRDTTALKLSFPYLVQLTDSVPPLRPTGLTGIADTLGIVKLSWKPNTDSDIFGYIVFRSSSGKDEFRLLTQIPICKATYSDTISKQDLNRSVFYKIAALDQRQNQSELSQALEIKKADIIPPSIPVMVETKSCNEGIYLKWINSTSADAARHMVYRQTNNEPDWIILAEIPIKKGEKESSFTDADCPLDQVVRYKIIAVDKNGNQSNASISVDVKSIGSENNTELKKIQVQIRPDLGKVVISWEKPAKEVMCYKIYRREMNTPYELYETLEGTKNLFQDQGLKLGNSYNYRIKTYYADGSTSPFSKEIIVK